LHIYHFPHILDLVGTGLSSLSVVAGFAAFAGVVDDRTEKQRLGWLGCAVAFVLKVLLVPPLVQEQLYILPSLVALVVGVRFFWKNNAKILQAGVSAIRFAGALSLGLLALEKTETVCVSVLESEF